MFPLVVVCEHKIRVYAENLAKIFNCLLVLTELYMHRPPI
jgi:hypothetical protein